MLSKMQCLLCQKIYILMVAPPISNPKQHKFIETHNYSSFWFNRIRYLIVWQTNDP